MKLLTFTLLFFYLNCLAQLDSGLYYLTELKFNNAKIYLQKNLKNNNYKTSLLKNIDLHNLACAYSQMENYKECIKILNTIITAETIQFISDQDFYKVSHTKEWEVLLKKVNQNNRLKLHDTIFRDLVSIGINDQAFYYAINYYEKKLGMKAAYEKKEGKPRSKVLMYWDIKDSLNKRNLQLVKYYLSKNFNVLSDSVVGNEFAGKCFLVIQHSDQETMEEFLPIIKDLYNKKEAAGQRYALLYDRVSTFKNNTQYYGTQVNGETKQPFLIKDEKNVDKRREELGMEPLSKYLMSMGIIYNPKRKK